ncbi:MAG: GSCFA domain-containing protein [Bacteroidales bacterium]|nr:GSCFA domain-containing protein [Bacteroidales bacterium]
MKLTTEVTVEPLSQRFGFGDRFLFMGSCFADSVGALMQESGFNVTLNPFGVLYNPASLAQSFRRLATREPFTVADVISTEGIFTSFYHHSRFNRPTAEEFLSDANAALTAASDAFDAADVCVVTLGTAMVFRHKERDMIVSNCHKVPAAEFVRERLSVEQCVDYLAEIVAAHPDKKWIFTVSPIRYMAFGAHASQISKATLLLAVDALQQKYPGVAYFPAYEIMMDELRDYRFYEDNLIHPSRQAVEYIYDCFRQFAIDPACEQGIAVARKAAKASRHRKFQFGNTTPNE